MLPQVYQEMFKMRMQMTFCGKSLLEEFSPTYTFPNDKILDHSKLKEFAGNNFKFDKDDVKFSKKKGVENTGKKEKLLVTSTFYFSHSIFKRLVLQTLEKPGLVWERVKETTTNDSTKISTKYWKYIRFSF